MIEGDCRLCTQLLTNYITKCLARKNYTSGGFRKVTAPPELRKLLSEFWETNKDKAVDEEWPVGNIHTNHWEVPVKFVDISDESLVGGGDSIMEAVWDVAKKEVEQWTGMKMRPSSLYGIRIYNNGSILNSHVDRLPLISSCIVNVAQDGKSRDQVPGDGNCTISKLWVHSGRGLAARSLHSFW